MESNLTMTCPHCGGDQFIHPADANLESTVTCSGCKAELTTATLADAARNKEALRLAAEAARTSLGHLFKQ